VPIRTVMFRNVCSYCEREYDYAARCEFQYAVLACNNEEHMRWARRDAKAWLHRNGHVLREEYSVEPLFQQTDLLTTYIKVKRTNGNIDDDWKIRKPVIDDFASLYFFNDEWHIPVIKNGDTEDIYKCIPISHLKMSIGEEFYHLVDALITKLNTGFYTTEAAEYENARDEQETIDNNFNVKKSDPIIRTELVFSPSVNAYGLVFRPPNI
jgi:hypothetical protein